MGIELDQLTNYSYLCSKHFQPECFVESFKGRRVLKKNACPNRHYTVAPGPSTSEEPQISKNDNW